MQSTSPLTTPSSKATDNASDALDRFHEAIRISDLDECNRLYDEGGINVCFMNCDGHRPIRVASENGHDDIVEWLLGLGADENDAVYDDDDDSEKSLLHLGSIQDMHPIHALPDVDNFLYVTFEPEFTILEQQSKQNQVQRLRVFLNEIIEQVGSGWIPPAEVSGFPWIFYNGERRLTIYHSINFEGELLPEDALYAHLSEMRSIWIAGWNPDPKLIEKYCPNLVNVYATRMCLGRINVDANTYLARCAHTLIQETINLMEQ